jgi:hypothetical protein
MSSTTELQEEEAGRVEKAKGRGVKGTARHCFVTVTQQQAYMLQYYNFQNEKYFSVL